MKSPIELLVIIADKSQTPRIKKILNSFDLDSRVIMSAEGTTDSLVGDIFSFGVLNKTIITTIVQTSKSKEVCEKLITSINYRTQKGIVFTMPISAISSDLFEMVKED